MRVCCLLVMLGLCSCATTSSTTSPDASVETTPSKAEKNRLACRKMCEVAGDAEDNTAAVADCQRRCDAESEQAR